MDSLAAQPQSMGSMEFYEKGVVIGHGTHGHVYRAIHRSSGQAFAVKKVRPGEDEGVSMTALREIKLLRELKGTSPHVVDLVDAFPHKGKLLLVYELLEGDLDAIIKDNGEQLGPAAVKCVMQQLLKALAHIHAAGIVHRDIKPDNLLMSSVGCLKVGDFGLARTMPPTALQQARWAQRPLCSVNAPRSPFFPTPGLSSNCMQDSFDPSSLVLSPMSALQATISPRCQSDAASSMLTDCCSPGLKYTNQVSPHTALAGKSLATWAGYTHRQFNSPFPSVQISFHCHTFNQSNKSHLSCCSSLICQTTAMGYVFNHYRGLFCFWHHWLLCRCVRAGTAHRSCCTAQATMTLP